jgi:hypothetical protein
LLLVISIKEDLEKEGWIWQAERLDNWIHRAQKHHGFLDGKHSVSRLATERSEVDVARGPDPFIEVEGSTC